MTFEKTPFYMVWPHIPQSMIKTCHPWKPKIIVMLRNPVDRLFSHYTMRKLITRIQQPNGGRSMRLERLLNSELKLMHQYNLSTAPFLPDPLRTHGNESQTQQVQNGDSRFVPPVIPMEEQDYLDSISFRGFGNHGENQRFLQRGMYAIQLSRWLNYYTLNVDLMVIQFEQFKATPQKVYKQVLNFLGVDSDDVSSFLTQDEFYAMYRPEVHNMALAQLREEEKRSETLLRESLSPSTRKYLYEFYHPYNQALANLLGNDRRWLWKDHSD